ncbi:Zinc finger matrin-type protein 4 [Labeo rohita]|uniref:Zinc finger matrin-type protein 4 n=1 Tax=Labeo rohita TaxID=84645 RepID=A0ABQ8MAK5_LABRO|nr:Zinc finger matrin-type protein 4 [Labeo rohita]
MVTEDTPGSPSIHGRLSHRYCQMCKAWFNNPGMARQHYDGKKHKKNAAQAHLLTQLGLKRSHTCEVCSVTLNSVAQYHAHLQGSKHQNNLKNK